MPRYFLVSTCEAESAQAACEMIKAEAPGCFYGLSAHDGPVDARTIDKAMFWAACDLKKHIVGKVAA